MFPPGGNMNTVRAIRPSSPPNSPEGGFDCFEDEVANAAVAPGFMPLGGPANISLSHQLYGHLNEAISRETA